MSIMIDGGTHVIGDLVGIDHGFRENNQWLAVFTSHALPASFYVGNAPGSFISWMRLLTGHPWPASVLSGLRFPILSGCCRSIRNRIN